MRTKKIKSTARYGARYGAKVKKKLIKVESLQRKKQKCPFCKGIAKRIAKGIWQCKKCKKKFASDAYYIR